MINVLIKGPAKMLKMIAISIKVKPFCY